MSSSWLASYHHWVAVDPGRPTVVDQWFSTRSTSLRLAMDILRKLLVTLPTTFWQFVRNDAETEESVLETTSANVQRDGEVPAATNQVTMATH